MSSKIIIEDVSLATSVPEPMAIPILADFIAGASFTPSPVTATNSPCLLNDSTISNLFNGVTLVKIFFDLTNLSNSFFPFWKYSSNSFPDVTSS